MSASTVVFQSALALRLEAEGSTQEFSNSCRALRCSVTAIRACATVLQRLLFMRGVVDQLSGLELRARLASSERELFSTQVLDCW